MTDIDKPHYKLTNEYKRQFYVLTKWVHHKKNVYAETWEYYRNAEVYLVGNVELDEEHSTTFEVGENDKFEIVGEHLAHIESDGEGVTKAYALLA